VGRHRDHVPLDEENSEYATSVHRQFSEVLIGHNPRPDQSMGLAT
jgi:hypothetical protein